MQKMKKNKRNYLIGLIQKIENTYIYLNSDFLNNDFVYNWKKNN